MRVARTAAMIVVTGLAACGDDGGTSKSEYVKKADALCAAADRKIDAAFRLENRDHPKPAEAQKALQASLPQERKLVSDLRELERPGGDEDQLDRLYDTWENAVDALEAASLDPDASLTFIVRSGAGDRFFDEVTRAAGAYGLAGCAASRPTLGGQPG